MKRVCWRKLRSLVAERRAVAIVETALLGPIFFIAIVLLFQFTYVFMAQMLLDNAVQTVARSIQTGQAQNQPTQTAFNNAVLCPALLVLPCSNLLINIQTVGDFYSPAQFTLPMKNGQVNPAALAFCNGTPGELILVNVTFMAPVILGRFFPGAVAYKGGKALPLYAAAAFADEPFPVSTPVANPC